MKKTGVGKSSPQNTHEDQFIESSEPVWKGSPVPDQAGGERDSKAESAVEGAEETKTEAAKKTKAEAANEAKAGSDRPPVAVFPSQAKTGLLSMAAFVFCWFLILAALKGWQVREDDPVALQVFMQGLFFVGRVLCGLLAVFFAGSFFFLMNRLMRGLPLFYIDQKGVYDKSSMAAIGLVPWDQIQALEVKVMDDYLGLDIQLKDYQGLRQKQIFWRRALWQFSRKHSRKDIQITAKVQDRDPALLRREILAYWEEKRSS